MAAPRLVSLADAKENMRVTHAADDALITRICDMASSIVINYLWQYERTEYQTLPILDPLITPALVQPWAWPLSSAQPYWWPAATRISYQSLPPYVVQTWIGEAGSPSVDPDIPGEVVAAVHLVIANLYDKPHDDPISDGVKSLLHRWRDPAMA